MTNLADLGLCVGLVSLAAIFFVHGRGRPLVHPVNVYSLTVLCVFYLKYLWIEFGRPVVPLAFESERALFFIALVNATFFVCYSIFKRMSFCRFEAFVRRLGPPSHSPYLYVLLAGAANLCFATVAGGTPFYGLVNPIEFRLFMQKGGMYYVEFLIFAFLISGVAILSHRYISGIRAKWWLFFVFYGFAALIALNTGLRGRFIEVLAIPLVVFAIERGRLPRVMLALVALVIIPFVTLFGIYRDAVRENSMSFEEVTQLIQTSVDSRNDEFLPLFMHRFDAFDNFVKVIEHPPQQFLHGESFLALIAQPLPRAVWPEKPQNFTSEMTLDYRPDLFEDGIALTFSAYAEAYLNLGYILGAAVLAFVLSIIVRCLDSAMVEAKTSATALVLFVNLYQLPFTELSAGFINDIGTVVIILSIVFLMLLKALNRRGATFDV